MASEQLGTSKTLKVQQSYFLIFEERVARMGEVK